MKSVAANITTACLLACLSFATVADDAQSLEDRDAAVPNLVISHFASRRDTWPANPNGYIAISPQTSTVAAQLRASDVVEQLPEMRKRIPSEAVSDFISQIPFRRSSHRWHRSA